MALVHRSILALLALPFLALAPPAARGAGDEPTSPSGQATRSYTPEAGETAEALRIKGDPAEGGRAFERCAVCHGAGGEGRPDGTFPVIAGQHATVVVKQLADMRAGRRRNPVMEEHARELPDARALADLAAYVATLPRPATSSHGSGEALGEGARLYAKDCARCHGASGQGDAAAFVPALAGQHYAYLVRQLRAIAGGRRRDAHPAMAALVREYRDEDLVALADCASRLGATPPAGKESP